MYCTSLQCSESSTVCYICGIPITEEEHYNHFEDDPFGSYCVNKKKGDDAAYDAFIAHQIEQQE